MQWCQSNSDIVAMTVRRESAIAEGSSTIGTTKPLVLDIFNDFVTY